MLEELPDAATGLTRTETRILELIGEGTGRPGPLFGASQKSEAAMFMGDWSFFDRLCGLAAGRTPLITGFATRHFINAQDRKAFLQSDLALTGFGLSVLQGQADRFSGNDVDFWWGGTHVSNQAPWRWDPETVSVFVR
jgi:hypothetical protein